MSKPPPNELSESDREGMIKDLLYLHEIATPNKCSFYKYEKIYKKFIEQINYLLGTNYDEKTEESKIKESIMQIFIDTSKYYDEYYLEVADEKNIKYSWNAITSYGRNNISQ